MEDKLMEEQENKYTLVAKKKRIAVAEKVYKAYYQLKERERYLAKLAAKHDISLEECEEKGIQIEFLIACSQESIEDKLIKAEMIAKMLECLNLLDKNERMLINELFFKGKSERQLSVETGRPLMTINDRKRRILKRLQKLLEK